MPRTQLIALACLLAGAAPAAAVPVSLGGSPASMARQHQVARDHGLEFFRTPGEIAAAVERGELVEVRGNADYQVLRVGVAQPEVRLFLERFGGDYRAACGAPLVVTSLTRAVSRQPSNAHPLSVHPAGMAVDLRVPAGSACERWMNGELLRLEGLGVLDATRERRPPHFHIAVFPQPYLAHVREELGHEPLLALGGEGIERGPRVGAGLEKLLEGVGEPLAWMAEREPAPSPAAEEESQGWLTRLLRLPLRILGISRT
jgi:hypothetical protein